MSNPRFNVREIDGKWRVMEFDEPIETMKPFSTRREAEVACTNYFCIWLRYYAD